MVTFCVKVGAGVVITSTDSELLLLLLLETEVRSTEMVMLGGAVGPAVVASALPLSLLLTLTSK